MSDTVTISKEDFETYKRAARNLARAYNSLITIRDWSEIAIREGKTLNAPAVVSECMTGLEQK